MRNVESYKPPRATQKTKTKKIARGKQFGIKNDPKVILRAIFYGFTTITLISCVIFSGYHILKWRAENDLADELVKSIQTTTVFSELADNDKTTIVSDNRPADDPYWQYVKMPLLDVSLDSAKATNPNAVGWLEVPGTNINYPFVQSTDNDFYLTHSLNHTWSSAGWVFLDYRNNRELTDKNQIIYAHGRVDGSMFGSLTNVLTENWQNNPNNHIVKISTAKNSSLWQVFSVYQIPVTDDYLITNFSDAQKFQNFLNLITNRTTHKFNTNVSVSDRILTLSTCVGTKDRAVLHAKLIKLTEK